MGELQRAKQRLEDQLRTQQTSAQTSRYIILINSTVHMFCQCYSPSPTYTRVYSVNPVSYTQSIVVEESCFLEACGNTSMGTYIDRTYIVWATFVLRLDTMRSLSFSLCSVSVYSSSILHLSSILNSILHGHAPPCTSIYIHTCRHVLKLAELYCG